MSLEDICPLTSYEKYLDILILPPLPPLNKKPSSKGREYRGTTLIRYKITLNAITRYRQSLSSVAY